MTRRHPYTTNPFGSASREPFTLEDPEEVVLPLRPQEEASLPSDSINAQKNVPFEPDTETSASGDQKTASGHPSRETWQDAWEDVKAELKERASAQPAEGPVSCPLCADAEKGRLLALAELENVRKRLTREKEEFVKYAAEGVLSDILPALDNLDLALAYAPESDECKNFVVGVDMTRKLLLGALARHGLEQIGELGEPFDPVKHEAVGMQPDPERENGQVCNLMSKGYRLKERLLRPARVIVCKND